MMKSFFLSLVLVSISVSNCKAGNERFNALAVTWDDPRLNNPHAFDPLPTTVEDATSKGWVAVDNGCKDKSLHYSGTRYMLKDDVSVFLIFDGKDRVAGTQIAIPREIADNVNGIKYSETPALDPQVIKGKKVYVITAYFIDPSKICVGRSQDEFEMQGTAHEINFQNGTGSYIKPPMTEDTELLKSLGWSIGGCVPSMGLHYFLGVELDSPTCASMFQIGVMYDSKSPKRELVAINYYLFGDYTKSTYRFEYVTLESVPMFLTPVPKCVPDAYKAAGAITSCHVFFINNPKETDCPK